MKVDNKNYYACKEGEGFALFSLSTCKTHIKCLGFTQDLPADCLDMNDGVVINDDAGCKRKIYKVIAELDIKKN